MNREVTMSPQLKLPNKTIFISANSKEPIQERLENPDFTSMQKFVGGWVETFVFRYQNQVATMVCNEEGLIRGLPRNQRATELVAEWARKYGLKHPQVIVGNVIVLLGFHV